MIRIPVFLIIALVLLSAVSTERAMYYKQQNDIWKQVPHRRIYIGCPVSDCKDLEPGQPCLSGESRKFPG